MNQSAETTRSDTGKRSLDLLGAVALLICFAPLLAVVAAAVRFNLGRPILFFQERVGRGGRIFTIWKFRSMRDGVDSQGRPLPDAERLTPFGRLLRKSSLDELPQLVNVLRGEMSLVGPRPLLPRYLDRYTPRQARRHEVLPGITGWCQIRGRNALSWEEKLELDVWYVEHRSLHLDLDILWRTIATAWRRDGISHGGEATMPEFLGTMGGSSDEKERAA
ncbi:MAG: sugar transferase [Thermoguttaceae bacterium]